MLYFVSFGPGPICHATLQDYMHHVYSEQQTYGESRYLLAYTLCPKTLHAGWITLPVRKQRLANGDA